MKHLYFFVFISIGLFSLPAYCVDNVMLAYFKVDDISWDRKGKNLFAKKAISVEAIIHSINLEIATPTVNVSFSLNGVHHVNIETFKLFPQKASFILQEERYDPKKNHNLEEYVDQFFQNSIKGVQQFWSEEVDIDNIGSVKLIFQRDRNIRYHKTETDKSWKLQHDEEFLHKSVISIPYGFEGEEATNTQDIFTIEHEEQLIEHPDIWFFDNQRWLKRIKAVEYTTVRSDLVEWAKANNIPVRQYSVLEQGKGEVFVLYPFSETSDPLPKFIPEGDALNQYYRLGEGIEQQVSHYIHYDRGLFKPQGSLFKCYLQEMEKDGLKFTFKNKKDAHAHIYTVKQSQKSIILPPRTGSGGQVVKDREFKKGLYRLLNTQQQPAGDIMQFWGEEPDNGENVTIRFSSIYANGKRASLTKYPGVVPAIENMQIALDLSNYLHTFKASEFNELKHYLHTIFWIEQKEPVVKYYHAAVEIDQLRQANNYLNNLIKEIGFLRIKLDSGYLLTYEEEEKWTVRIADAKYLSGGTCLLSLNSQLLVDTIKNIPTLRELDLATIIVPNLLNSSFFTFLADEQRIEHVGIKTLTRDMFKEIGLTDSQIIKLAIKSRSLEHLDVSGVKGLCEQGDQFIAAIRLMKNLQSLNVLKADLSNSQTVALSKVLLDKEQLKNVKLTLPYVASTAWISVRDTYKDIWDSRNAKGGWFLLASYALYSPIMVPALATINAGFDMLGMPYWNDPFVFTYRALASIPSLENLTLETSGVFDQKDVIKNEIKDLRENRIRNKSLGKKSKKLSPVSIEFFK